MAPAAADEENAVDSEDKDAEAELKIPPQVVKEGSRVVRRELERVVVIEAE